MSPLRNGKHVRHVLHIWYILHVRHVSLCDVSMSTRVSRVSLHVLYGSLAVPDHR